MRVIEDKPLVIRQTISEKRDRVLLSTSAWCRGLGFGSIILFEKISGATTTTELEQYLLCDITLIDGSYSL